MPPAMACLAAVSCGTLAHMGYWAVAQVDAHRVNLVLHYLELAGHATYAPRIAVATSKRRSTGNATTLLFPSYVFVAIEHTWWQARWSVGVRRLILSGDAPAKVPDRIIAELKGRENKHGLVVLPRPPGLKRGDRVRITGGLLTGRLALFEGMRPHERVEVLLRLLGGETRVELPKADVVRA